MHGDIQVKMKKKCKYGLFVSIKSVSHLTQVISSANMSEESFEVFDKDRAWADSSKVSSCENSDADMGFTLFD